METSHPFTAPTSFSPSAPSVFLSNPAWSLADSLFPWLTQPSFPVRTSDKTLALDEHGQLTSLQGEMFFLEASLKTFPLTLNI